MKSERRHPTAGVGAEGRAARERVPLEAQAVWEPPGDRPDPVWLLEQEATTLVAELVPVRHGRMASSLFDFFAGAAAVMAADLARTPSTGFDAQLNGDAHADNFAAFESSDFGAVFDMRDFDETLRGPWEWDLKRLATSCELLGRELAGSGRKRWPLARTAAAAYQAAMQDFSQRPYMSLWSDRSEAGVRIRRVPPVEDPCPPVTRGAGSSLRFASGSPELLRLDGLFEADEASLMVRELRSSLRHCVATLTDEGRQALGRYAFRDAALRVAGVGRAATQTSVVALEAAGESEPLVLEIIEASRSVLEQSVGPSPHRNHGRRVVEGERLLRTDQDLMLGWVRGRGPFGVKHDYHVRRLRRPSRGLDRGHPDGREVLAFARTCGRTLARAHARTGDRFAIAAYMGSDRAFASGLADFARAYANQAEEDYGLFRTAIDRGRIVVRP